jgi:hypothetical protein
MLRYEKANWGSSPAPAHMGCAIVQAKPCGKARNPDNGAQSGCYAAKVAFLLEARGADGHMVGYIS